MTWILPKQLHTLVYALDTEALISDLNEQSQICAQSLLLRSKPSPARIWSRKWKRDSWTQHLSGRILKPSLGESFTDAWTSLVAVTRVSHSALPANDSEQTTRDISGRSSQLELLPCDHDSASLKTSKGTFLWDLSKSYETFKDLVIAARSEYSARLKLARRISESGSSSWPTAQARDWKDCGPTQGNRTTPNLGTAVHEFGPAAQANPSSRGNRPELSEQSRKNWQTFAPGTHNRGGTPHRQVVKALVNGTRSQTQVLTVDQVFAEEIKKDVSQHWPTPSAMEAEKAGNYAQGQMGNSLSAMAKRGEMMAWATPECKNHVGYQVGADGTKYPRLGSQVGQWATPNVPNGGRTTTGSPEKQTKVQVMLHHQTGGKLNARWVETLMGLPVGWTMPSCASPVTPEWTSSDCSETESCQQQPSEPLTS